MLNKNCMLEIKRTPSEYIRGIAIAAVVLEHILCGVFGVISGHLASIFGIGGVTIFLLLSGYGLYQSYCKNGLQGKTFWNKKMQKVFIPYAVITVVFYLYMMVRGDAPAYPALLKNILCIDYARTIDSTMWYMSFQLIWYAAFFCVFYFNGPRIGKLALLMLLGLCFSGYWLKGTFLDCAWQFAMNAFAFPLGVGLGYVTDLFNRAPICEKRKGLICMLIRIVVFAGSLTVLILAICKVIQISYWKWGLVLFFVLYTLLSLPKREIKILKWLGKNSFMIYLVEGKLISIFTLLPALKENVALYLLCYAVAVVAVVYLYRFGTFLFDRVRRYLEEKYSGFQI